MGRINTYNNEVRNWNFETDKEEEFLRLLTERNLFIQEQTQIVDFHAEYDAPSKNEAKINSQGNSILEQVAFHVGFPHQRRLYTLVDKQSGNPNNEGVFFTLRPQDVVYFSEFDEKPFSMVYLLDVGAVRGARLQTEDDSSVISRYDLDDAFGELPTRKKTDLMIMHRQLNEKWIRQNTIPFNVEQLEKFKQKRYEWLVVPDPIEVKY